jgi:hypothetical protein
MADICVDDGGQSDDGEHSDRSSGLLSTDGATANSRSGRRVWWARRDGEHSERTPAGTVGRVAALYELLYLRSPVLCFRKRFCVRVYVASPVVWI